jgi:hypothetical protein
MSVLFIPHSNIGTGLNVGWNGYVDLVKITENFASITANRN